MNKLTRILKALSDETRLRILNMLFERECCVCELLQVLEISQPRASHHLSILYAAGLLKLRRQGLFSNYSIDWETMDDYAADLVKAAHKGLAGNLLAQDDLKKLAKAERILPQCGQPV
ncbi:MAG: metalloregulator ArsR/SmtB family transcription factor [Dehalococcoidia bacterium]|nr:metalloregulator ArsR/SmtB family transcription factor [Dehalococcoidia bacterium]